MKRGLLTYLGIVAGVIVLARPVFSMNLIQVQPGCVSTLPQLSDNDVKKLCMPKELARIVKRIEEQAAESVKNKGEEKQKGIEHAFEDCSEKLGALIEKMPPVDRFINPSNKQVYIAEDGCDVKENQCVDLVSEWKRYHQAWGAIEETCQKKWRINNQYCVNRDLMRKLEIENKELEEAIGDFLKKPKQAEQSLLLATKKWEQNTAELTNQKINLKSAMQANEKIQKKVNVKLMLWGVAAMLSGGIIGLAWCPKKALLWQKSLFALGGAVFSFVTLKELVKSLYEQPKRGRSLQKINRFKKTIEKYQQKIIKRNKQIADARVQIDTIREEMPSYNKNIEDCKKRIAANNEAILAQQKEAGDFNKMLLDNQELLDAKKDETNKIIENILISNSQRVQYVESLNIFDKSDKKKIPEALALAQKNKTDLSDLFSHLPISRNRQYKVYFDKEGGIVKKEVKDPVRDELLQWQDLHVDSYKAAMREWEMVERELEKKEKWLFQVEPEIAHAWRCISRNNYFKILTENVKRLHELRIDIDSRPGEIVFQLPSTSQ